MKIVCAYLLAALGGNTSPTSADLKNILSAVAIDADDDRLELFMSQVAGKSIEDIIASGRQKLASVPSGGGGAAATISYAPAAADAEPAKEEKAEDKEESDEDIGFSLFDDE